MSIAGGVGDTTHKTLDDRLHGATGQPDGAVVSLARHHATRRCYADPTITSPVKRQPARQLRRMAADRHHEGLDGFALSAPDRQHSIPAAAQRHRAPVAEHSSPTGTDTHMDTSSPARPRERRPTGRPPVLLPEGARYGRLTVIGMAAPIFRRPMHRLRCRCGRETVQHASALTGGLVKSCGCYRREAGVPRIRALNAAMCNAKRRDTQNVLTAIRGTTL